MADKIDQLKIGDTSYDIDLPPDATPSIASLTASGTIQGATIKKTNGTSSQFLKADGSIDSTTYLSSHQSIKTLNTNNTSAQTASSSEAIVGSGTINLHKVAKTGSYNDLLNKPTIPTDTNQTIKGNGTTFGANDAINLVGGTNIAVTPDTTNKKITVGVSYPKVTYSNFTTNGFRKFIAQTDYSKPFYAHVKIYTSGVSEIAISQVIECYAIGRSDNIKLYGFESTRTAWSGNSGIYQMRAYAPKNQTSAYANYAGGVSFNINSTTARNIEVEIFELENCTVLDTPVAEDYNSTYHNSAAPNTCSNRWFGADLAGGCDSSSNSYSLRFADTATKTSTSVGIGRYTLYVYDSHRGDGASITSTFNNTGTSHIVNTTTVFTIGSHIMYNGANADYAASTSSSTVKTSTYSQYTSHQNLDLRYSCNCGTTGFTTDKPLYLRVTPNFSTGTFTIHSDSLTQTLTNGGYYIYLGIINHGTTYRLHLLEDQRMYYYNGTTLIEIVNKAADSFKLNNQEASYYLNYNNLSNKPTIPSVSNATITIKQTGISDQTFTLNGSATTITLVDTNTWRPIGTSATDAAAGNHAHGNITNTGTITSTAVTSATGFLVYDSNNKIQRATSANARTIIGAGTYSKPSGGIPASDLAETYYLASNPNNYTSVTESTVSGWGFTKNAGTVTSVDSTLPLNGNVVLNAVSYVAQTLTNAQKTQARTNIGAGTSNFTGYTSSNKLSTDYINNVAGWTSNAGTVIGSGLTADTFVVGNGTVNVKTSTMKPTTSSTTWSTTSDVNVPTMKAISSYVTGLGYTKNTGTVTSVGAGTGLSISGTASVNPTVNIASGYKLPSTTEWNGKVDGPSSVTANSIPKFSGTTGKLIAESTLTITDGNASSKTYLGTSGNGLQISSNGGNISLIPGSNGAVVEETTFRPFDNATPYMSLGSSTYPWYNAYITSGVTIGTSDTAAGGSLSIVNNYGVAILSKVSGSVDIQLMHAGPTTYTLTFPTTTGTLALTSQLPSASYSSGLQISTGRNLYVPYATASSNGVMRVTAGNGVGVSYSSGNVTITGTPIVDLR